MAKAGDGGAWKRQDAARAKALADLGDPWFRRFTEAHGITLAQASLAARDRARSPARLRALAKALRLRCRQALEASRELAEAAAEGGWRPQARSLGETREQAATTLGHLTDLAAEIERRARDSSRGGAWRGVGAGQAELARFVLGRWPDAPRSDSAWAYFAIAVGLTPAPGDEAAWRALKGTWGRTLRRLPMGRARRPIP